MKCKLFKLRDENNARPKVLLGIITSTDDFFVNIRTKYRDYSINKSEILIIADSDQDFEGDENGHK